MSSESPFVGRYRVAPNPVTSERLDTAHCVCKEQKENYFRHFVRLTPCENAWVRPGLKENFMGNPRLLGENALSNV